MKILHALLVFLIPLQAKAVPVPDFTYETQSLLWRYFVILSVIVVAGSGIAYALLRRKHRAKNTALWILFPLIVIDIGSLCLKKYDTYTTKLAYTEWERMSQLEQELYKDL